MDAEGTVWPLNEAAATLIEDLGSAYGAPAPEAVLKALSAAREAGRPQLAHGAAGEPRPVSIAAVARYTGGFVALRDHTEERLLQERLLQSEKMASVGQLVSGVAHELNNPLTGVMGFAQLLLTRELDDTVRAPDPDDLRRGRARGEDRPEPALLRPPPQADEGDGGRQRPAAARAGAAQLRLHDPQHLAST